MFEAKSEDIRRFFDLPGSIFCGLVVGFCAWEDYFRSPFLTDKIHFLPLFFIAPLFFYLIFYRLVWQKVKTKAFSGNLNFLLISLPGVSLSLLFFSLLIFKTPPNFIVNSLSMETIFKFSAANLIAILPMAFFWFIGILTAWKFSKKNFLP